MPNPAPPDTVDPGTLVADANGRVLFVDRELCRVCGFPVNEVVGQSWDGLFAAGQGAESLARMRRTLAREGYWRGNLGLRRKDGDSVDQAVTITAALDADGRPTRLVALFGPPQARGFGVRNEFRRTTQPPSGPLPVGERLRSALQQDELTLFYQPQIDLRAGQVVGMEALLRWRHPREGLLSVGPMLADLDDRTLQIAIGEWVLARAMRDAVAWHEQGLDLKLGVNIASPQLLSPDFLDRLRAALAAQPRFRPEWLELEILESAALENTERVKTVIQVCRKWGVSYALDDFGTGYASLSYLRNIPAQVLKIDRSFVVGMLDDREDRALVKGIIDLATNLRRLVIAEGVENREHATLLMRLGCDLVQGFGIGRPMPLDEAMDWAKGFAPDPYWSLWADTPWQMQDLPLLVARLDHIRWVERVAGFVDGSGLDLSDQELANHRHCRFGGWFQHQGRARYGHLLEYAALDPVHREVHELGARAVEKCRAGDMNEARALVGRLQDCKKQVLQLLDALEESVAQENNQRPGESAAPAAPIAESPRGRHGRPPLILVAAETRTQIELLTGALSDEYRVKFATAGQRALLLAAQPDHPELVLLDEQLGDMDSHQVCRLLKDDTGTRNIPVVMLTAGSGPDDQERCFTSGAVDLINKPFDLATVRSRVRTHLNLKRHTDLLEAQASIDPVTGIANRRRFDEALRLEWKRAARDREPLSMLMLDLDFFKKYNDSYGHSVGDHCLRQVGLAMADALARPADFAARYGGEEFVMVLPGCSAAGAQAIAERVRSNVEAMRIAHVASPIAPHVTISIGCATEIPALDGNPLDLVERADQALYQAKHRGRNQVFCRRGGDSAPRSVDAAG